jgi:hypothetical protein
MSKPRGRPLAQTSAESEAAAARWLNGNISTAAAPTAALVDGLLIASGMGATELATELRVPGTVASARRTLHRWRTGGALPDPMQFAWMVCWWRDRRPESSPMAIKESEHFVPALLRGAVSAPELLASASVLVSAGVDTRVALETLADLTSKGWSPSQSGLDALAVALKSPEGPP